MQSKPQNRDNANNQFFEQELTKIYHEADQYKKQITQLQGQIDEIKRLSQQIQYDMSNSQNKANPYQDILRNCEAKINSLQEELKLLDNKNSIIQSPQQKLINAYVPITSSSNYFPTTPYQTNVSSFNYNPSNMPPTQPITNYQVSNTTNPLAPSIQVSNQEKMKSNIQPIHDDKLLKASKLPAIPEYNPTSSYVIDPKTTYITNPQLNSQMNPSNMYSSQYAGMQTIDYYGDPKVKAIIDEVHLNKSTLIL